MGPRMLSLLVGLSRALQAHMALQPSVTRQPGSGGGIQAALLQPWHGVLLKRPR